MHQYAIRRAASARLITTHRGPRLVLAALVALAAVGWASAAAAQTIVIDPTTVDFGLVDVNTSANASFDISNTHPAQDLIVTAIAEAPQGGDDCGPFTVTQPSLPLTLNPSQSVTISVSFAPTARTAVTCTVQVDSNDAGSPDFVTLQGTGTGPLLEASVASIAFGDQRIGAGQATRTFDITNNGNQSYTMVAADVTVSGDGAFQFVDWPPGTLPTLGPSQSTTVTVGFDPAAEGAVSATIAVTATAHAATESDSVALSGTGTASVIAVSGANDFGNVVVGNSRDRTFTIENQGSADLQLNVVRLQNQSPTGQYAFVGAPPAAGTVITPSNNVSVTIRCTPAAIGVKTAELFIDSDADLGNDPEVISLTCRGQQPDIAVAPGSIGFGARQVGSPSNNQTVTISNASGANVSLLTVSEIRLGGSNPADFSFTPNSGTVAPGNTLPVSVGFNPTAPGPRAATLTIVSDDPDQPSIDVALTGEGREPPDIAVSPTNLSFGEQTVDTTSAPQSVTISNASGAFRDDLTVSTITVNGTNAGDFAVNPSSTTVPAGNSRFIEVTFRPGGTGSRSAQLRITSNDPDESIVTVDLSGTGVAPNIFVQPPLTRDFGDIGVSQSSFAETVTIQNTGTAPLIIAGVNLGGNNPGDFRFDGATNLTVPPSGSASWDVFCTPGNTGNRQATFLIPSNDADLPTAQVALQCNGVDADLRLVGSLDFPDTYVATTSAPITVQLENVGIAVDISSITVSNSAFRIVSAPSTPFTLQTGSQVAITVEFEPSNSVSFAAELRVETNLQPANFPVTGRGIIAELGVSPNTFDFGEIRVGLDSLPRTFTLSNIATASFQVTGVSLDDAQHFTLALADTLPITLSPGAASSFDITAHPTVIGQVTGTITIDTDIPGAGPVTIAVDAAGTAPDLNLSQNLLDFGGIDVQGGLAAQQTVTITNTGTLDLAIGNIVIEGDPEVAFRLAEGQTVTAVVTPGESFDVVVEYLPVMERTDGATLVVTSDAISGARIEVPLSGRGIDRHIEVSALELSFPATYRHPVAPATIPLDIRNTGEAPLVISMVMAQGPGAAAFSLVGAEVMEVAPGAVVTVSVGFAPTAASGVPYRASLFIVNDDDDRPMVEVTMSGSGLAPNLLMAPSGGLTLTSGVGIPALVADLPGRDYGLRLMNQDQAPFTVRAICLGDTLATIDPDGCATQSGPFRVVGGVVGQDIAPAAYRDFDVEFLPDAPGSYEVAVAVFLDADPDPVAFTIVRGRAVEVSLNGGGCGAGRGDAGGALPWLLMLLWAPLLWWRRARRARAGRAVLALVVAAATLLGAAAGARADGGQNLDLALFRPVPAVDSELMSVESPAVGTANAWAIALALDHAINPLELETARMRAAPVSARTAAELGAAYAFLDRYEAGFVLPLLQQSGDEVPAYSGLSAAEGTALGDLMVRGKASLWQRDALALASSLELTLPTASDGQYAGARRLGAHARAVAGFSTRRVHAAVNAGLRLRGKSRLADVEQGSELTYGVAGAYRFFDALSAVGEVYGAAGLGDGAVNPLEVALGVRYRPLRQMSLAVGVGRGLVSGVGAPDLRAFLLLSFSPAAREVVPVIPPPAPKPPGDRDDDGILDVDDACPDEKEDRDGFQDDDGCLDPDNDNDGRIDRTDQCIDQAEDYDGFQDDDGCPDDDNDGDGIPDSEDQCPDQIEDEDGFQDLDGCDDPDNDRDGLLDFIDQCVGEPETINGNQDDDGCPDEGESLVMLLSDRVELFQPIEFRGNSARLVPDSDTVLAQVMSVLRAHPEFVRVGIRAHVSQGGGRGRRLSRARAEAIRTWLLQHGVLPERIEAQGVGASRPLMEGRDRRARAVNERVEILILEKRTGPGAE
ncbi:choice-of-anchor D domain-containing protein [Haliangium sp.]|uniref:choice-of-anchor D domain-containing protein n=1 Tax=Haliangium sp. TaxID=2663208 RepID=UPI003D0A48C9